MTSTMKVRPIPRFLASFHFFRQRNPLMLGELVHIVIRSVPNRSRKDNYRVESMSCMLLSSRVLTSDVRGMERVALVHPQRRQCCHERKRELEQHKHREEKPRTLTSFDAIVSVLTSVQTNWRPCTTLYSCTISANIETRC